MADTAYTDGRWNFKQDMKSGDCGITAEGTGVFIEAYAEIRHHGENARVEALANARLIAAAPDLLEALKALSASIFFPADSQSPELRSAIEMTVSAISKAEGRS